MIENMPLLSNSLTACLWCHSSLLDTVWEQWDDADHRLVGTAVCQSCQQISLYSRRPTFWEQTQKLIDDDNWDQAHTTKAPERIPHNG